MMKRVLTCELAEDGFSFCFVQPLAGLGILRVVLFGCHKVIQEWQTPHDHLMPLDVDVRQLIFDGRFTCHYISPIRDGLHSVIYIGHADHLPAIWSESDHKHLPSKLSASYVDITLIHQLAPPLIYSSCEPITIRHNRPSFISGSRKVQDLPLTPLTVILCPIYSLHNLSEDLIIVLSRAAMVLALSGCIDDNCGASLKLMPLPPPLHLNNNEPRH